MDKNFEYYLEMAKAPIPFRITDRTLPDESKFEQLEDFVDAAIAKQDNDKETYISIKIPEKFRSVTGNKDQLSELINKYKKHWRQVDLGLNGTLFLHK